MPGVVGSITNSLSEIKAGLIVLLVDKPCHDLYLQSLAIWPSNPMFRLPSKFFWLIWWSEALLFWYYKCCLASPLTHISVFLKTLNQFPWITLFLAIVKCGTLKRYCNIHSVIRLEPVQKTRKLWLQFDVLSINSPVARSQLMVPCVS